MKTKYMDEIEEKQIIEKYNSGIGTNRLAELFERHRSSIQALLLRKGIKPRKRAAVFLSKNDYFKNYNNFNCYWAGFILADGYIREKYGMVSIKLQIKDKKHLEKFKIDSGFEGSVREYKNLGYITLDICNREWIKDLKKNFSITPRKSHTAKFNKKIPNEFLHDFIRGIMDGDGSVGLQISNKAKNKYLKVGFVGTDNIILNIRKILTQELNIKLIKIQHPDKNNDNYSALTYSCLNAEKVLEWLYKDSDEHHRMDRKYQRWLDKPFTKHR